jgi:hypothetical protein
VSLREQAAADLRFILEGDPAGFRWPITITNPAGVSQSLFGFSSDVHLAIDPETGQAVVGRRASAALSTARLAELGLEVPRGVGDAQSKPWVITFADIGGASHRFKVVEAIPDRAIGIVVCTLEVYR